MTHDVDDRWEEIRLTLRIEEVLDELGVEATSVRGDEWFAHCPLPTHHGADRNPSFSVNTDKMIFSCFSCAVGGTPIKLAMRILNIGYDEAVDWLAKFSDFTAQGDAEFLEQVRRRLDLDPPAWRESTEAQLPWYPVDRVTEWAENLQGLDELWVDDLLHLDGRNRHISREVAAHLLIGYDPSHSRGSHTGPALIIPVFVGNDCVGWQERWLGDRPSWVPKYTNTTDFPRGISLYNQRVLESVLVNGPVIVVESPLTVARLLSAGIPAVGTYGAKVSEGQRKILRRGRELWFSFDNDEAGRSAVESLAEALDNHTKCWVIPPPEHAEKADLGDCNDEQLIAALEGRTTAVAFLARI